MKKIYKILLLCLALFVNVNIYAYTNNKIDLKTEDVIDITKPSIVKVVSYVKGKINIPNFRFDYENYQIVPLDGEFPIPVDKTVYGTGFIISSDGIIATNSHIVEGIIADVYKTISEEYLKGTTESESKQALIKHKDIDEAYDEAYKIIYRYLYEKSNNNLNKTIKILKPYDNSKKFSEIFDNGYDAKVLYSNPFYEDDDKDVAILKIETENLPTIPLIDDSKINIVTGQKVYTFGFPSSAFLGGSDFLEPTFSQGVINAIKNKDTVTIYQTDAKVSSGSSGSPLFDKDGNVIGILSLISGSDTNGDNFGFAIKSTLINQILNSSGIQLKPNLYFEQYKSGLYKMMDNRCKSAIDEFKNISNINPDFYNNKNIDSKIEKCNQIIKSGQSNDSVFYDMLDRINNYNYILIITIIILFILFVIYFLRRIHKDEQKIEEIEEIIDMDDKNEKKEKVEITQDTIIQNEIKTDNK